jgi:hypothetical protein
MESSDAAPAAAGADGKVKDSDSGTASAEQATQWGTLQRTVGLTKDRNNKVGAPAALLYRRVIATGR